MKMTTELTRAVGAPLERIVRRGQVFRLKDYGQVRFDRLDFFMGQCTAKLTGITHEGTYYPLVEQVEKEGFTIIDA
jgi:hypothetical protein